MQPFHNTNNSRPKVKIESAYYNETQIISIYAEKGGVSKSNSVLGLSGGLRYLGVKHLLIDTDPFSRTITSRYGLLNSRDDLRAVCMGRIPVKEAIHEVDPLVSVIPASMELEELDRSEELDFEPIFQELSDMGEYQIILIDLPPGRSDFAWESLVNSDWVLVPTKAEMDSAITMRATERRIWEVKKVNPALRWLGCVVTMYQGRTVNSKIMLQQLKASLGGKIPVLRTILPLTTVVAESALHQVNVVAYAPNSKASQGYVELAKEIIEIIGG